MIPILTQYGRTGVLWYRSRGDGTDTVQYGRTVVLIAERRYQSCSVRTYCGTGRGATVPVLEELDGGAERW